MKKKGYLQISFAWIFAIIVGAFILFLAIYASVKIINLGETGIDAKTGKEIGILLNPLETGFESVKATSLSFPVETRIYDKCNNEGYFGRQIIQVSQKSFGKWTSANIDGEIKVGFSNKYIFSEIPAEGKKFYLFSKPFYFPFKVADLIYISSSKKEYCFIDAPEEIKNEVLGINQENLLVENCSDLSVKICFDGGLDCDVNVNYGGEYVEKKGEEVFFKGDALMYAAIFSDKNLYECQLKRLMKRIRQLASLYKDKAIFISRAGCHSNLNADLIALINLADNLESSEALEQVNYIVEEIKEKNDDNWECKLW